MYDPKNWAFATVDAIIIEKGKILLEKRAPGFWGGYWCFPGGHVEKGGKAREEVVREVLEETGLKVKAVGFVGIYSGRRYKESKDVTFVFLCEPVGGKLKPQPDETEELSWFPLEKLPKKMGFDHRKIISDAVAVMSGKRKAPIIS